jgi:hypothetical protein
MASRRSFTPSIPGQANLSISSTKYWGLDGIRRPGSFDYPVMMNAVVGYKPTKKWGISGAFRFMTGRPYTPFNELPLHRTESRHL